MKITKYILPLLVLTLLIGCSTEKKPLEMETSRILEEQGVDAAVKFVEENYDNSSYIYDPVKIDEIGKELFITDEAAAFKLFEANHKLSTDQVDTYISLARAYQAQGNSDKSAELLVEAMQVDSLDLGLEIARKRRFFVPDDFEIPTLLEEKPFIIRPISVADAELDFDAIRKSIDHLKGVLGDPDWPDKYITLEEDQESLVMHEKDFQLREGFTYAIMNMDETKELGCLYIYPARVNKYDAEIVFWLRKDFFTVDYDLQLYNLVGDWLKKSWPFEKVVYPGRNITWQVYFDELNQQDQKYH